MRFDYPWPGEMTRLQNELERLFGDGAGRSALRPRAFPPVNLWEDEDNLYVETEIPGVEPDELEVFASDENHLTLQGERKPPEGTKGTWHRQERVFGRFSRIVELPVPIQAGATSAEFKAGVLKLTMPKKEEAKPRRISVKAG